MKQLGKMYTLLIVLIFMSISVFAAEHNPKLKPVTISTVKYVGAAPTYIAYHKGYFKQEGLDVNLISVSAGKLNLTRVFKDEAHIGATAETPIVYSSFDKTKYLDKGERDDFYIIANIMRSPKIRGILARKDSGIKEPKDLKGKKAAVFKGTASDFLMDVFLTANGLKISDLEVINMKPGQMVKAITAGEIDVMFSWQPHIMRAQQALGENGLIMPGGHLSTACFPLIAKKEYVEANPERVAKVIKALVKAQQFMEQNKDEAIDLFIEATKIDKKIVTSLWDYMDFDISLDQALLLQMEDQARWMIRKGKTKTTDVPNYLKYIYFDGMEKVKPEGVTIIK